MNANRWTFEELAADTPDLRGVKRDLGWFRGCVELEKRFDLAQISPLTIHPREGLKEKAPAPGSLEIYEGLHRALILAHKLVLGQLKMPEIRLIYLYPNRPTKG
jgi:hypothetical protein